MTLKTEMYLYIGGLAVAYGAIAWYFFSSFIKSKPNYKYHHLIIAAILSTGLNQLNKRVLMPYLLAKKTESCMQKAFTNMPAFNSMKVYEPETYDAIAGAVTDILAKTSTETQAIELVRAKVMTIIKKKLPQASDEAVIDFVKFQLAEMTELQNHSGELCYQLIFPINGHPLDINLYTSKELQKRSLATLDQVIKSYDKNRTIPSESTVDEFLTPVYQELAEKYGNDVSMLENPTAANVNKNQICNMMKDIYRKILTLPHEQSLQALRRIFSSTSTITYSSQN